MFAKQLNRHIFGFPTKNLTNIFKDFIVRIFFFCNSAVFSPTALSKISIVKNFLRLPVDISLIENRISHHYQYFEGSSYIYCSNQHNSAVAALLQLVSYPDKFLSQFYTFHVDINNLHLLHQTNCQN